MFENMINPFQNVGLSGCCPSENIYTRQYNVALNRFRSALHKGKVFRLRSRLMHRPQWLYDLNALKPSLSVRGSFYAGVQVVPIRSIIGSEGRTADFDMDFHPMSEAGRDRWVNMAIAHLSRIVLSPIQLIQVGEAYFVRDGHHRISVARAFGQVAMDAEVIAWRAAPPFPWQLEASLLRAPAISYALG
jgi:hypothetical protein